MLRQSYLAMPNSLRRQAKTIYIWYQKAKVALKMIHYENSELTDDEFVLVKGLPKKTRHACFA